MGIETGTSRKQPKSSNGLPTGHTPYTTKLKQELKIANDINILLNLRDGQLSVGVVAKRLGIRNPNSMNIEDNSDSIRYYLLNRREHIKHNVAILLDRNFSTNAGYHEKIRLCELSGIREIHPNSHTIPSSELIAKVKDIILEKISPFIGPKKPPEDMLSPNSLGGLKKPEELKNGFHVIEPRVPVMQGSLIDDDQSSTLH